MPPKRMSRNAGKVISIDDIPEPEPAAAAVGRATRSKAAAPADPKVNQPAPAPKPKPAPKPRRAAKGKGKEKTVTIADTSRQIDANVNLATETQAYYVRKTSFIARCLKATDMQKLINQPDKVIDYIVNRYPNMNSRTGYLVAFVSLIKHTTLQVTDAVQQKYFDAMMKSAGAAQEVAKENVPRVASVMLNGKPIQWKDVLECEKRLRKDEFASRDHLLVSMYTLIPPRRLKDYCKMEVFKSQTEFNNSEEPNKMFLNTRNKFVEMSIGNYKTAKTYDKYEVKLTGVLFEIIKTSMMEHKRRYLFQNTNQDSYTSGTFSKYVTDTFKRVLKTSLGCNGLRHLKITALLATNLSIKAREELAYQMGNSAEIQQVYNIATTPAQLEAKEAEKNAKLQQIKDLREQVDKCIKKISQLSQEIVEL
jgi:hypothetical protein